MSEYRKYLVTRVTDLKRHHASLVKMEKERKTLLAIQEEDHLNDLLLLQYNSQASSTWDIVFELEQAIKEYDAAA